MKAMTCRQLGGPCELEHQGVTADEIIVAQDRHLKEAEQAGRRHPPGGPRGDEGPLAAAEAVPGLVRRRQAHLRRATRGLAVLT